MPNSLDKHQPTMAHQIWWGLVQSGIQLENIVTNLESLFGLTYKGQWWRFGGTYEAIVEAETSRDKWMIFRNVQTLYVDSVANYTSQQNRKRVSGWLHCDYSSFLRCSSNQLLDNDPPGKIFPQHKNRSLSHGEQGEGQGRQSRMTHASVPSESNGVLGLLFKTYVPNEASTQSTYSCNSLFLCTPSNQKKNIEQIHMFTFYVAELGSKNGPVLVCHCSSFKYITMPYAACLGKNRQALF